MQGLLQMQQREGLPGKEACRAVCRWFIDAHSDIWGWAQPYSDANSVCTGVGNSLDHQTLFRKCQQPSPCRGTAALVLLTRIANWEIWSRFELLFCCLASSPTWFVAIVQWRTKYFSSPWSYHNDDKEERALDRTAVLLPMVSVRSWEGR